jgi:glycosyltransferase involved in cell wall biosynthesis
VQGEPFRLCYSGKFAADYLIEETVEAFVAARRRLPFLEFHVYGDKFHGGEAFERRVRAAFAAAEGLHWHGAKPRHLVNEALSSCHAGISWRTSAFDDSKELSTKVLEYSTLGLPVLLNPATIQRRVFGDDYPCFVSSSSDVVASLERLTSSDVEYRATQSRVRGLAEAYGFPAARRSLSAALAAVAPRVGRPGGRRSLRVLLAGHDLKFAKHVARYFRDHRGDRVDVETWGGHERVSPTSDPQLAERADLIWCEWCLGNAVHHARKLREEQRLVVRLHHQELRLPHRRKVDWQKVDALISICPGDARSLESDLGSRGGIVRYIPNLIDCDALSAPRQPDSEFRLGMLGFSPSMKRPDLALDILAGLRARDRRYSLSLKGQLPWMYPWLWERPEERAYYERFFARVRESEGVHFDAFGDVTPWLATIGTVLSTSDYEGSHQAVAEGMAAGVVPCIRSWEGADLLYPKDYVFDDVAEAVDMIDARRRDRTTHAALCQDHARREFDFRVGYERLDALLADVLG